MAAHEWLAHLILTTKSQINKESQLNVQKHQLTTFCYFRIKVQTTKVSHELMKRNCTTFSHLMVVFYLQTSICSLP